MNESQDDMSIDDFKRWTVASLRSFIKQRGMKVSGTKEELVARAYVAWELKLEKVCSDDEYKTIVKEDYNSVECG